MGGITSFVCFFSNLLLYGADATFPHIILPVMYRYSMHNVNCHDTPLHIGHVLKVNMRITPVSQSHTPRSPSAPPAQAKACSFSLLHAAPSVYTGATLRL